jgi:hypothetical protein
MSSSSKPAPAQALTYLFSEQDKTLLNHLSGDPLIAEAYHLTSDACCLSIKILSQLPFVGEKYDVISTFAIDAVSATVVAARIALWGNPPEAMSILRCAVERSAQLMYIVGEAKYKTAKYEMEKGSFNHVSYDTAVASMGDLGKRITRLHGLISGSMAHATVNRLGWSLYEKDGNQCARIGSSDNPGGCLACLSQGMDVLIVVLDRLRASYVEDNLKFEAGDALEALNDRFLAFKPKCEQALANAVGG